MALILHVHDFRPAVAKRAMLIALLAVIGAWSTAIYAQEMPAFYFVENLDRAVNSPYQEYGPIYNPDDSCLYFTSRRERVSPRQKLDWSTLPSEDIYVSQRKAGSWTGASKIQKSFNGYRHESTLHYNSDQRTLLIYKDSGGGDIFFSSRTKEGTWAEMIPFGRQVNSKYAEISASLTADGNKLYFASNRPGGYGGFDIYCVEKSNGGKWGKPKNLGPTINTPKDEDAPFISPDGLVLYFSSNGHAGYGDFDIYKARFEQALNTFEPPLNMGAPINSSGKDLYFTTYDNGNLNFFASDREDGHGFMDIYQATMIPASFANAYTPRRSNKHLPFRK